MGIKDSSNLRQQSTTKWPYLPHSWQVGQLPIEVWPLPRLISEEIWPLPRVPK